MYRKLVKLSLALVYLVIIAGALVRMTGSGMGCPDWPKCFGYYIPPTEVSEIEFKSEHDYEKGQVIIVDEALQVAATDFRSGDTYNPSNWNTYTKHDYAIFNPWHTWVEYLNRLAGALAGIVILIMAVLSFSKWKIKKRITLLSWLTVFLMGFQAWLGATVVYSVLSPVKITVHMLMALVIVAILLYLMQLTTLNTSLKFKNKAFQSLMFFAIIFTLIQITSGTQVRQLIDEQIKLLGYGTNQQWLENPSLTFYVHRSFSILILLVNLLLWRQNKKLSLGFNKMNWIIGLIFAEILTGMAMYYLDFPVLSQPLHLVIATLLFGFQFYILLEVLRAPKKAKSL